MAKKNTSLTLSLILTKTLLVGLIITAAAAPKIASLYDRYTVRPSGLDSIFVPMLITMYLALIIAFPALLRLNQLLENLKNNLIFVDANVKILRLISYFCYAEGVIFFGFGFYRSLSFAIFAAAVFFGLIIRVLKNVFAAAVSLKEENDFTI